MTDLEKRAFAFIKLHTLYDKGKNKPLLDCSNFELMAKFAQQETTLLSKHILELQKTNSALTDRVIKLENAELKCECKTCVYTDSPCVRGDFTIKETGHCAHYKHFNDKIQELKEENENLKKTYRKQRNKRIDDLQKKNAELDKQITKIKKCLSDIVYMADSGLHTKMF